LPGDEVARGDEHGLRAAEVVQAARPLHDADAAGVELLGAPLLGVVQQLDVRRGARQQRRLRRGLRPGTIHDIWCE
jgi:hypothetical protein